MANRLASETSPYLLQHAANPVDWYPWGDEAFAEAQRLDKPVLLSVGYSSCHWCHVMAHESFEDDDTARLMNELFVNVKVDREERPDVDAIYMNAVQAMTGRGGWPMTVWLTPDQEPFYAGTYFPKDDRPGMPSFRRVLRALAEAWTQRRDDIAGQAARIAAAIDQSLPVADTMPGRAQLEAAYQSIVARADDTHGGIGGAPKFPQEPVLEFLLRVAGLDFASDARRVAFHALDAMAAGGLYDHVGGGFFRYSVDSTWTIPHFEKMLYTNAQLARLYLRAWQMGGPERYRRVAEQTLQYLSADLRVAGGFGSAEDADSEGVEGKFYVYSAEEFWDYAGDAAEIAGRFFGVTDRGNFEGANHLRQAATVDHIADELGVPMATVIASIEMARERLHGRRSSRVRPELDDKVITAWNALAIRAFAEAGAILGGEYLDTARQVASSIRENLVVNGLLQRSYAKGKTSGAGFLDDHAGLAVALYTLYQATGEVTWFEWAQDLVSVVEAEFVDGGMHYSSARSAEPLITRPRDQMDNPLPSGSSLAAEAYLMRALLTGQGWDRFEQVVREAGLLIDRYPTAAAHLLALLASREAGLLEVAVTGPRAHELAGPFWEEFRHNAVVAVDDRGDSGVPLLENRFDPAQTRAFVCREFVCDAPVSDPDALRSQLDQTAG